MLELFHAAPSYYSMVARLALAEAQIPYTSRLLDIHLAKQQLGAAYRQLNPHMTVPTLRGPALLLTDSADILRYASEHTTASWADAEPQLQSPIQTAVDGHYAISIETLTFSKLLAGQPWLKPLITKVLSGLVQKLDDQAADSSTDAEALQAKAKQNRQRLATLTAEPAAQTLAAMRAQVITYLHSLPTPEPNGWLFGRNICRADVVVAVLCARLSMAGELELLQRPDLQHWWQQIQQRPAFAAADIWTRFRRRDFVGAVLQARHTPITASSRGV
ncbi:MAG: glutathione S-transferase family protein [Cyanobacteriota bacterium]|nr:glutathione S-transferase family protein [Cyanobacteriota bacterium]